MKKTKLIMVLLLITSMVQAQEEKDQTEYSHRGYYNSTSFGLLIGSSNNENRAPFSFTMINGYGITDQFAIGLGFGSEFINESYLPVVIEGRYYFRKSKFSPFAFVQGGYSIPLDQETAEYRITSHYSLWSGYDLLKPQGGFLINPGVGIKTMFSNNLGMTFTIAYRFQKFSFDKIDSEFDESMEIEMNRLEIKIGIFFK